MKIEIDLDQLTQWLVAGVAELDTEDNLPESLVRSGNTDSSFPGLRLRVELPDKYAAAGRSALVLADEIVNVTAATPALTREIGLRLANQGEGWVPVAYVEASPATASDTLGVAEPMPGLQIEVRATSGITEAIRSAPVEITDDRPIPALDLATRPALGQSLPGSQSANRESAAAPNGPTTPPRRATRPRRSASAEPDAPATAKPKRVARKREPRVELPLDGGLELKP